MFKQAALTLIITFGAVPVHAAPVVTPNEQQAGWIVAYGYYVAAICPKLQVNEQIKEEFLASLGFPSGSWNTNVNVVAQILASTRGYGKTPDAQLCADAMTRFGSTGFITQKVEDNPPLDPNAVASPSDSTPPSSTPPPRLPGARVDVPIVVGGTGTEYKACDEDGDVAGLDPHGDGFLSVRSGPGGKAFHEIDRVYNGMHLKICDGSGPWLGVVYSSSGEHCNVEHDGPVRLPYTGPCRYGWVFSRYVGNRAN